MLLKAFHDKLTEDRESTYLTAAADAGATTLTVAAIDIVSWVLYDPILIGEFGEETAEIVAINGATTAGTSLTVSATIFAHPLGTKIHHLDYQQVRFVHSTSSSSADIDNANLITLVIEPSNLYTRYEDTTNSTGYGSFRFRNSTTNAFSSYAAFVPYTGYTIKSLWKLREKVRKFLGNDETIENSEIDEEINDSQREVMHDRVWNFAKIERSLSSVDNQVYYTIPSTISNIHTVTWDSQPLVWVDQAKWDRFHWDTTTVGDPTHCNISGTTLKTYPKVSASASSTTLAEAITSTTATSIVVVDGSAFRFSPYARFIIDSEVIYSTELSYITTTLTTAVAVTDTTIYVADASDFPTSGTIVIDDDVITYTGTTATTFTGCAAIGAVHSIGDTVSVSTFTGCLRGQEDTTAATHLLAATVTERDIVLFGQKEPDDLVDTTDETDIPEPEGLAIKAAANLALARLGDKSLADRLEIKYEKWIEGLRDRFSIIIKSQSAVVRDASEVVADGNIRRSNFPDTLDTTSGS